VAEYDIGARVPAGTVTSPEGPVQEVAAGRNGRPDYPQIGERLRSSRRARGLSLRDLAQRLGVSPSLISQIELGRANPSVSTLYALVSELGVSLDDLLFTDRRVERTGGPGPAEGGEPAEGAADVRPVSGPADARGFPLQQADLRQRIRLASGVIWERLTTVSEPGTEFLHVTYEVGGASSPEGYVISGTLQVRIGFDEFILKPGDAISIDSGIPHRLANIGDEPVHAVWFVLGRSADSPLEAHKAAFPHGSGSGRS
jgi:transcriptional regulator with XRE-family HTH domain